MTNKAFLLDEYMDPEDVARTPGVYVAPSDSPSFGVLQGLLVIGKASPLGETMLEDGRRAVAVEVTHVKPNPEEEGVVTIGAEFFAKAKADYKNWREKWWREAIQNSVDAGATRIDCHVQHLDANEQPVDAASPDRKYVLVSVSDNGSGMTEDILARFLRLGGTGKDFAAGSVGGFGKAKELLLFGWIRWGIATRDVSLEGHGAKWTKKQVPAIQGTKVVALMAADECTEEPQAIAFIRKCFLPHVRFYVNGNEVKANLKTGELVRELPHANVYFEKKLRLDGSVMLVRVKGMYMHERWVSDGVKGTIIIELTGRSVDILTSNRDGISDYNLDRALDRFQNEIAADTKSALKKKKNIEEGRKKYKGTGKYQIKQVEYDVLNAIGNFEPPKKGEISEDVKERILDTIEGSGGSSTADDAEEDAPIELKPPKEALRAMLDIKVIGSKQMEIIAKQFAWEPDFYVYNDAEDFHVPSKFMPEKMTPQLRKLAKFWAELCRFVLIQLNYEGEYGVGWVFSGETGAAHLYESGENWLLLNPFDKGRLGGDVFSLSNKEHVNWLYAAAVHEATHMADGITHHNESFASALTMNVARTANRGAQIEKIRKAVVARGPSSTSSSSSKKESGDRMPSRKELGELFTQATGDEMDVIIDKMKGTIQSFDQKSFSTSDNAFDALYTARWGYPSGHARGVQYFEDDDGKTDDWTIRLWDDNTPTLFWNAKTGSFVIKRHDEWRRFLSKPADEPKGKKEPPRYPSKADLKKIFYPDASPSVLNDVYKQMKEMIGIIDGAFPDLNKAREDAISAGWQDMTKDAHETMRLAKGEIPNSRWLIADRLNGHGLDDWYVNVEDDAKPTLWWLSNGTFRIMSVNDWLEQRKGSFGRLQSGPVPSEDELNSLFRQEAPEGFVHDIHVQMTNIVHDNVDSDNPIELLRKVAKNLDDASYSPASETNKTGEEDYYVNRYSDEPTLWWLSNHQFKVMTREQWRKERK